MQIKIGTNENQAVNTNIQTQEKAAAENGRKAAKQQRKATIFAGDLPLNKDPITLRRQQAQKKAMKFVQDARNADCKTDQSIAEYETLAEEQRKEFELNQGKIGECRSRKENLREGYGVEKDSQEQKDLELLERRHYPGNREFAEDDFTEEERKRLKELEGGPLTEYQQKCLEIDDEERIFRIRAGNAESTLEAYNGAVRSIKQERLKFHKMTDAQNNAKKVMDEASKDIQGMVWEEAKDHVDETYEEQREEAKEKAEEKEEQEEKIELRKEQKELMEARIEAVREDSNEAETAQKKQERDAREEAELLGDMANAGLNVAGASDAVKAEIKDLLNKMKLIEADIKGIEVDEEI
ncbi:MAG: hypothetical protein K2I53_00295 [Lachnospiraceae bacterium]|nr:hypothetical protein [Lachnospiraceae bacterium]